MNKLIPIFKLLSDETRLRILMLLYQEDLCVCEITGIIDSPQPRISKNLSKLRDMMIVEDERREKYVFYHLKRDNPFLMRTLKSISDEIERYPILVKDREKLKEKDQYMNLCQIQS